MLNFGGQKMINKDRLVDLFMDMTKISSPSLNEREIADFVKNKLLQDGFEVYEDKAGEAHGGNAGNVIGFLKGNGTQVMLSAHLDTVVPCENVIPMIKNDKIVSDGRTILGADDKAGIAAIIEAVKVMRENNEEHPDIVLVFSIAEEIRLLGARYFDFTKYNIKYGFIFDSSGKPGTLVKRAPYQNTIFLKFLGKAAHAGIEPEKGINALYVAAHAISKLKMGRIDSETTFNLGTVSGGLATNIVMEDVEILGEARSFSEKTLGEFCETVIEVCRNTAEEFKAELDYDIKREYDGFDFSEESEIIQIVKKAVGNTGLPFSTQSLGGGSDTNIYNTKGINTVNLGIGMSKPHSLDEFIEIKDLVDTARIIVEILREITKNK